MGATQKYMSRMVKIIDRRRKWFWRIGFCSVLLLGLRLLTMLRGESRYVLVDRDTNFLALRDVLEGSETKAVLLPPKSPSLNANLERYMWSMESECLSRMIFFSERSLRRALAEFDAHYHYEHNHQGLGNNLIEPGEAVGRVDGNIACRNRLGGMLRYYYRKAA